MIKISKSRNLFVSTKNYFFELFDYQTDKLVVTFEPAGQPYERPQAYRAGWGSAAFRVRGISHLCVKPKSVDWYRKPDIVQGFEFLARRKVFENFDEVITYGGSMGGFAAMVYADLIGAKTVFAINPQTTMDKSKVPWEDRFERALLYNWKGPYSDVAEGYMQDVEKFYVCLDRRFPKDWNHMMRLSESVRAKMTVLNFPYVNHEMPGHMTSIKILTPLMEQMVEGNLDLTAFRKKVRERRDLKRYYNTLEAKERVKKSPLFQSIVAKHKAQSPLIGLT
ncbi:MAG: hypothetical protein ABJZ79_00020 [Parasphingorhabdus sp.]|uniref:hypothetical protein n=1 Tax=Parasphingorhabdus sp. TaxID=2709688 RepID=UPI00329960BA